MEITAVWQFIASLGSRIINRRQKTADETCDLTALKKELLPTPALPQITVETSFNYYKSFTLPNPDIKATIYAFDHVEVGKATFAVSPLFDRIYLFDITVHQAFRRQHFGLAFISFLAVSFDLPITTIKEVYSASDFWRMARRVVSMHNLKIDTISISEMDGECARWSHLQAKIDDLNQLVSDRLCIKREAWEDAVSRGLPDWPEPMVLRESGLGMWVNISTKDQSELIAKN